MISIIVPNFNKGAFLQHTINSIINQSFIDWELIIVDDHSTDNSWNVINDFVDNIKIFAFRPEKKLHGSGCRNYGLSKAVGKYVMFLDSDDIIKNNCLINRSYQFNNNKNFDFLVFPTGTFYKSIGDNNNVWRPKSGNHLKYFLEHDLQWTISGVIWKKSVLLRLNGFDESYFRLQDVELHTRALLLNDIKYKIFPKVDPDNYYRIDHKRTNMTTKLQLEHQLQGVLNYFHKINLLLVDLSYQKKYLRGTIFTFITRVCLLKKNISISPEQSELLIAKLLTDSQIGFFASKDYYFVRIYTKLYHFGFYKFKGFNFLFKKLFIHI